MKRTSITEAAQQHSNVSVFERSQAVSAKNLHSVPVVATPASNFDHKLGL